jgi:putative SOS response-associated peptidase YedK
MCGRYTLKTPAAELARIFSATLFPGLDSLPDIPRYNIAPTQPVLAVRSLEGRRMLSRLRWGLIPSWAKDPGIASSLINARGETVAEKPSFRTAFQRRRCLIPSDGFYEWKAIPGQKTKQPMFVQVDNTTFAMAGLWERWNPPQGEPVETCTIITTAPNELMATVHNRMPVILPPSVWDAWLDPAWTTASEVVSLLRSYPAAEMQLTPVSTRVNNVRNEGPELIAAAPDNN